MSKTVVLSGNVICINTNGGAVVDARITGVALPELRQCGQRLGLEASVWMLGGKYSAVAVPRSGGVQLTGEVREVSVDHLTLRLVFPVAEELVRNTKIRCEKCDLTITDGQIVAVNGESTVTITLADVVGAAMNLGDGGSAVMS